MPNFKYIKTLSVHPKIQSDLEYDHNLIKHDSALCSGKVPTVFSIPMQQTVLTEFTLYLFRIFYKAKIVIHFWLHQISSFFVFYVIYKTPKPDGPVKALQSGTQSDQGCLQGCKRLLVTKVAGCQDVRWIRFDKVRGKRETITVQVQSSFFSLRVQENIN